jgi:hypothetical protein
MYSEPMSKKRPGCIVVLIDQSGSMSDPFAGSEKQAKDAACALAVNRVLRELVLCCSRGKSISPRCEIGVIGYGGANVASAVGGRLSGKTLVSIADVADSPLRVDRSEARPYPVWIEPKASGGTPMTAAFVLASEWLSEWTARHPDSFPPIVINITDGEPDDEDSVPVVGRRLCQISTSNGAALLLNAHISSTAGNEVLLPDSDVGLPDAYARLLFDLSSVLPDSLRKSAEVQGFATTPSSRGFVYNANVETLVRLLTFGSRPAEGR